MRRFAVVKSPVETIRIKFDGFILSYQEPPVKCSHRNFSRFLEIYRIQYSQNFGQLHEKGPNAPTLGPAMCHNRHPQILKSPNAETPGPWCDNTPTQTIVISAARLMADQQSNSVYS